MLANYTFKDGVPKKLGDPGIPTIPCSVKKNYVKTALCDLGAASKLIFHDKIQQSSINFTRFNIGKRSNRGDNKIIIVGI